MAVTTCSLETTGGRGFFCKRCLTFLGLNSISYVFKTLDIQRGPPSIFNFFRTPVLGLQPHSPRDKSSSLQTRCKPRFTHFFPFVYDGISFQVVIVKSPSTVVRVWHFNKNTLLIKRGHFSKQDLCNNRKSPS